MSPDLLDQKRELSGDRTLFDTVRGVLNGLDQTKQTPKILTLIRLLRLIVAGFRLDQVAQSTTTATRLLPGPGTPERQRSATLTAILLPRSERIQLLGPVLSHIPETDPLVKPSDTV